MKDKDALNQQIQSLRSQMTAYQSDLNLVKADRDKVKTELGNANSRISQLEAENENLRSARDAQAKRTESLKTGLQSLIQDLNDRQNKS